MKRNFVCSFGLTVGALFAVVATMSIVVDPYGLFVSMIGESFPNKVGIGSQTRPVKAQLVRFQNPEVLILGSSRAEHGIVPSEWSMGDEHAFNYAVPAASMREMRLQLQHAATTSDVRDVLLFLDFFAMDAAYNRKHTPNQTGLALTSIEKLRWPIDLVELLLSKDAVLQGFRAVDERNETPKFRPDGVATDAFYMHRVIEAGGYQSRFELIETAYVGQFSDGDGNVTYSLCLDDGYCSTDELTNFLDLAADHGINVTIIVGPVHARLRLVFRELGFENVFGSFKRTIAEIVDSYAEDRINVLFFDFALVNEMTTEFVPDAHPNESRMSHFWDPSHYSQGYGATMSARVRSNFPGSTDAYGGLVNLQDIERILDDDAMRLSRFAEMNHALVEDIRARVQRELMNLKAN